MRCDTSAVTDALQNVAMLATCFLMLMAVAILRDGTVMGHPVSRQDKALTDGGSPVSVSGNTVTVNTSALEVSTPGYGGAVPLVIAVTDGRIAEITPLRNAETPEFFSRAVAGLVPQYVGLTPEEALNADIDGVTGATFSSRAIKANVTTGMQAVLSSPTNHGAAAAYAADLREAMTPGFWASLIVVLAGAVIPLLTRSRTYRIIQLVLNFVILGLWTATFLNYTMMLRFMSAGVNIALSIVPLLMLVTAFVYPLFGRKNHYCLWVCPFGAMQELAGKCSRRKLRPGPGLVKWLGYFRLMLWAVLMLMMWTEVWFGWIDYELFSAFVFSSASIGVLIGAAVILILSVLINRPYCRFICPTGTLFKISENQ